MNENSGRIRGMATREGYIDTTLQGSFFNRAAAQEGRSLTKVHIWGYGRILYTPNEGLSLANQN